MMEAYSTLEPFGPPGDDDIAARICQTVANASGRYKKAFKQATFARVPIRTEEEESEHNQKMADAWKRYNTAVEFMKDESP